MVVFGIKGEAPAAERYINRLKLFSHLANVGKRQEPGNPSCQHYAFPIVQGAVDRRGGSAPDLVRLSIGIEDIAVDIIEDIDQVSGMSKTHRRVRGERRVDNGI